METPNLINNLIISNLAINNVADIIINTETKEGSKWSKITFSRNVKNKISVLKKEPVSISKSNIIKNLYDKVNRLETHCSIKIADKFLIGYLEYHNTTIDEIMSLNY